MKKMFFVCCIAVSALALSTSANTNNYHYASVNMVDDTTPPMMSDSMHHGTMKMHKKSGMNKDSGMNNMHADSTSTTPPKK